MDALSSDAVRAVAGGPASRPDATQARSKWRTGLIAFDRAGVGVHEPLVCASRSDTGERRTRTRVGVLSSRTPSRVATKATNDAGSPVSNAPLTRSARSAESLISSGTPA